MSEQPSLFDLLPDAVAQASLPPLAPPPPKLTAAQRAYLSGPIITADASWADTVPEWLYQAIPHARLQALNDAEATEEETLAYLATASLIAPLDADAAECYFWLAAQVLPRYGCQTDVWDALGLPARELRPDAARLLHQLRCDIRRSVERHAPKEVKRGSNHP